MSMVDLEQLIAALKADLSADEFVERGMSVQGTFDHIDDPVLIGPDGTPIMTSKEGYPYDERMSRHDYEDEVPWTVVRSNATCLWHVPTTGQTIPSR